MIAVPDVVREGEAERPRLLKDFLGLAGSGSPALTPGNTEYDELKDLDMRRHTLKFKTAVASLYNKNFNR